MGCGSSKATKVTANSQRAPPGVPGDFSNINPNNQMQIDPRTGQPMQTGMKLNQQMNNGQPFPGAPGQQQNGQPMPPQQYGQQYPGQQNMYGTMGNTNRNNQDDEEDGEDGEEDFEEEWEDEDGEMHKTVRSKKSAGGAAGSLGNTFRGTAREPNQQKQLQSMSIIQEQPIAPYQAPASNFKDQVNAQKPLGLMQKDPAQIALDMKQQELAKNISSIKMANDINQDVQKMVEERKKQEILSNGAGAAGGGTMFNRFQDPNDLPSNAIKPIASPQKNPYKIDDPTGKDGINSAIDAYQKQMKDFKNSLSDMNQQYSIQPTNQYSQPQKQNTKITDQLNKMGTYGTNLNSDMQSMQESGTLNLGQTQHQQTRTIMNETKPLGLITQKPLASQESQNLIGGGYKPYQLQTQETRVTDPKKEHLNVKPTLYQDDDDEFQNSNYYNFDKGYQKHQGQPHFQVELAKPSGTLEHQPVANMYQTDISVNQKKIEDSIGSLSPVKNHNQTAPVTGGNEYRNVKEDKLTIDDLNVLKEQFQEQEERERLNPQNVLLRILLVHAFNASYNVSEDEMNLERKLYSFFLNKNSNVLDLKDKLRKDFGFDADQLRCYFKYRELTHQQYIMDIENFDLEEDILMVVSINAPKNHLRVILREPLEDIKIGDVRFLNSRDRGEGGGKVQEQLFDLEKFDVDQDKLPWPLYRDWTSEAAFLSDIIVRTKKDLLADDQHFLLQQGYAKLLLVQQQFQELVEAEATLRKLQEEFRRACLYAVHLIVKKNPTPLNLYNLYGDDGDKYIVGGIMVRRAKDWFVCGQSMGEGVGMTTTVGVVNSNPDASSNMTEVAGKVASLDVRNLALLRNRVERLVVPLTCLVDYYGLRFEAQSLAPLSINSLAYGSDTNGVLFQDFDQDAEYMALQIASMLNLKPHFIEEHATGKVKKLYLPYTVQLHRNKDLQGDHNLYLVSPFRLFPSDESLRDQSQQSSHLQLMLLARQLRPELTLPNNKSEPAPNHHYFTWRSPQKCDECLDWIQEHEYFYFEKRSVDKTQKLLVQYYCCQSCYQEHLPSETFKYPVNKLIRKELPAKERLQYWQDIATGKRYFELQYKKVPLNPDAYMDICNTKDRSEKVSDQEEIVRCAQKLKDEVLTKLIEDLNSVEEDPHTSDQLESLLHSRGVTMRHLGKLCTMSQLNHLRELAVIEVIARSAKVLIKDGLTFLADDEEAGFQSANIKRCVVHYLQEIFNLSDVVQSTSTQSIWDFITEHARKKFQVTIERDVLHKLHLNGLLLSLCQKLNLRLKKSVREINFYPEEGSTFITVEDIDNIVPMVKDYADKCSLLGGGGIEEKFPSSLNIVLEAARLKDSQGKRSQWHMIGGEERVEATELFRMATNITESIYSKNSLEFAKLQKEFAEQLESRHQERGRPENSRWNRCFAVPEDELSMEARYYFQNALNTLNEIGQSLSLEAAQIHIALARLFKPRGSQFSHYREKENNIMDMYQNLMQGIEIYELMLGFDHPETADAYTKMALAYQEQGNFAASSPWIRRAFTIFYKCFGPHDDITLNVYEYLKSIEINIDSRLEQVSYEDLPQVIYEMEKQQKLAQQQQIMNPPPYPMLGNPMLANGTYAPPPLMVGTGQRALGYY